MTKKEEKQVKAAFDSAWDLAMGLEMPEEHMKEGEDFSDMSERLTNEMMEALLKADKELGLKWGG